EPIVHIIDGPAQLEQNLHAPFPLPRSREGTVSLPRLSPLSFGPAVMAPRPRNLPRPPRGRQLEKRTREDGRRKSILPRMSSVVRSAPGHAHVAGERRPLMASVDDEIVPLGLARDRFRDRRIEQIVAFGRA